MKTLCIGEALIDMICTDKGIPLAGSGHFLLKPGGAPTNVAAAIAALGGDAALAAKVGNDAFGQKMVQTMQDFGVSTQWMLRSDQHFTTMAFVSLLENGEHDFVFNRGADGQLTTAEVEAIDLQDVSIIHFGSATAFLPGPLQSAYVYLLQKALRQKIFVSFDPNYRRLLFPDDTASFIHQSWGFLTACDFFKCSEQEAMLLTGTHTVAAATTVFAQKTTAVFAITLGKEGTLLGLEGNTQLIPSIPVHCIDSTGAGDAFVGALLYQLANKAIDGPITATHWQHMVTNANKAGARTCEYLGAMEAFKYLSGEIVG